MKLLVNKFLFRKFLLKNKVLCVVFFLIFLCSILLLVGFTLDGEEQQKALESKEKNISTVEKFEVYSSKLLQDISSFGTISYSEKNEFKAFLGQECRCSAAEIHGINGIVG